MRRLTENQVRVLQCLHERGWLASWKVKNRNINNGMLDPMVKRGLIRKMCRPESRWEKKKTVHFHITKKGEKAWKAIEKPLQVIQMLGKIQRLLKGETVGPTLHR